MVFLDGDVKDQKKVIDLNTAQVQSMERLLAETIEWYEENTGYPVGNAIETREKSVELAKERLKSSENRNMHLIVYISLISILTILSLTPYVIPLVKNQIIPFFKKRYSKGA